jgi:hypothetical protein
MTYKLNNYNMVKTTNKFQSLHENYIDCLEYLATYGVESLNEKEQTAARKLALLAEEYINVVASDDPNYDREEEDDYE